jgi:hypothetical protein
LVHVAHGERMTDVSPGERRLFASEDTDFIGHKVYIFCALEGLATVFRGAVNYPKLARKLKLPDQRFVTFAQTSDIRSAKRRKTDISNASHMNSTTYEWSRIGIN